MDSNPPPLFLRENLLIQLAYRWNKCIDNDAYFKIIVHFSVLQPNKYRMKTTNFCTLNIIKIKFIKENPTTKESS